MLLKKLIITSILVMCCSVYAYAGEIPSISAQSAVLINAETKEVIFEKNAHEKRSMASTTKIMTSLIAIESGRLNDVVTAENMQAEGTSIGLKDGYILSLESLVWGMMLESGNDAAKLVANHIAGSEESFAVLMNNKANQIGMMNTNFVTASGLDSEEHCSTAYDMALLGAKAIDNPIFRELCSAKRKKVEFIEPAIVRYFSNHNRLLSMCDGVFGIKTGFTKKSGRCLVSACDRNGVVLVAVTLNAGDDWNDHIKLYNYGYDECVNEEVYIRFPDSVRVYGGEQNFAPVSLADDTVELSFSDTSSKVTQRVLLPELVYAPIECGDIVGKAQLIRDGKVICERDILFSQSVRALAPIPDKENFLKRIYNKIIDIFK